MTRVSGGAPFNLEWDAAGAVCVHILQAEHDAAFYHNMEYPRDRLWHEARQALPSSARNPTRWMS